MWKIYIGQYQYDLSCYLWYHIYPLPGDLCSNEWTSVKKTGLMEHGLCSLFIKWINNNYAILRKSDGSEFEW